MRPHGKIKLGFFPLPAAEARRLRNYLVFLSQFSALDPCVGDGIAFKCLLGDARPIATGSRSMRIERRRPRRWELTRCRPTPRALSGREYVLAVHESTL
jgi:hypothetical protein